MEYKFAVALMNGDDERIMGIFDTKEEADLLLEGVCHGVSRLARK